MNNTLSLDAAGIGFHTSTAARPIASIKFQKSVTIQQPVAEVYAFWRDLGNLPSFMKNLDSITVLDEHTSFWALRSSENHLFAWGVKITEDRTEEIISWRSFDDSDIETGGSVCFSPTPDCLGTVVQLMIHYTPPADRFRAGIAKVFARDTEASMDGDLARLKTLLGGTHTTATSSDCRRPSRRTSWRPVVLANQFSR